MVGPSITDDDRRSLSMRLRVGFALLVGLSGALVAVQGGAGPAGIAVAGVAGCLLGAGLVWYLVRIAPWEASGPGERGSGRDR